MSKPPAELVRRPRVSCFSSCFGVAVSDMDAGSAPGCVSGTGKRSRRRWSTFSWSRFRKKAAAARKTVPVETPIADAKTGNPWCHDRARKPKYTTKTNQFHEPKKPPATSKPEPCHKPSRKSSRPCSPELGQVQNTAQEPQPNASSRPEVVRKFDPLVGMSILMVALAMVLVWGRVCAIFCTSAWLYFLPRLRLVDQPMEAAAGTAASVMVAKELESEEYKKKVVFEGLLERSHQNHSL